MRKLWIHLGLFLAACGTTWWASGPVFAATLMTILVCHESGHYIFGRLRGVDVSLPYFIPMPPGISYGTLGAVINMKSTIEDRRALFDVGASGPIAGLVVAIPLLVIGLMHSTVGPINEGGLIGLIHSTFGPIKAGSAQEGNSILYALLKYAVFGRWLPGDGVDVNLSPMANAAWVGLLVTMINLMPIGQLDGGHIARAALGQSHEKWSGRLHLALPIIGLAIGGAMFAIAMSSGLDWVDALSYAKYGLIPWTIWALLLGAMRRRAGEYHPPVSDVPLDPLRRKLAIVMLIIFLLILTPVPMRPAL